LSRCGEDVSAIESADAAPGASPAKSVRCRHGARDLHFAFANRPERLVVLEHDLDDRMQRGTRIVGLVQANGLVDGQVAGLLHRARRHDSVGDLLVGRPEAGGFVALLRRRG